MKRVVMILCVAFVWSGFVHAEEWDFGVLATVPIDPGETTLELAVAGFKTGVFGSYDADVAPFFSPGGMAWISYAPIPLVEPILRFDFGGRFYSAFRLPGAELQPFAEYVLSLASANSDTGTTGRFGLGVRAIIDVIGIELAAILGGNALVVPQFGTLPSDLVVVPENLSYRVGFSYHVRSR